MLVKSISGTSSKTNTATVFHGSTHLFDAIDVKMGKPYKDFGRGFYVTYKRSHAANLALRNKKLEQKYNRDCNAYLYTFEMSLEHIDNFNLMNFREASPDWLKFVLANRKSKHCAHNYDIVMGPTANDDTMTVLNAYLDGLYGEVDSDEALQILMKFIMPDVLPRQAFFATTKSVSILTRKGDVEIL